MTRKSKPTLAERLTIATDPNAIIAGRIFQAVGKAMEKDFPGALTTWDMWEGNDFGDTQVLNFFLGGADVTVSVAIEGSFNDVMEEEKEAA
jgi:hypothetical protein